ncbi:MAG: polysaccharide deacetylase family protein [Firmicutes bacterium]|nr:polysaccharide deacetylase family protein [Bacillota bacterium]
MYEGVFKPPRGRCWNWILGALAILAALFVAAAVVVFGVNRFTLELELKGEPEVNIEYGGRFQEPGAVLCLRGSLLCRDGFTPKDARVSIQGSVDEKTPGKYTLTYLADYRGLHAQAQRVVRIVDTVCPEIFLTPDPEGSLIPGTPYEEAGYRAVDNHDGDITDRVVRTEQYGKILYAVTDSSGNPGYAQREIPFYDPIPPEITLTGGEHYAIPTGVFYTEPGYAARDNVDGDLTEHVQVEGEVDWLTPGVYPVTYTVSDGFENTTTVTRRVEVTAAQRPQTVWPENKTIYLTFDDGPGPETERLLDILDSYGVKATFFVTSRGCGEMMKEIVERGHSIGIHTVSHDYAQIYASPEAFFADLFAMQDVIYQNTGIKTTLMRFPGGSSNTVSRETSEGLMTLLTRAVQDAGFQYFDWNVDSNDAGGAKKAQTVFDNVIEGVTRNPVSVVLQHDIHSFSVDAVEDILIWGLNNGYTFAPLTPNSPGVHHRVQN